LTNKGSLLKGKLLARAKDTGMKFFSFFGYRTSRTVEYDFIMKNIPSKARKILDVGSTGSLLPLKLAKQGYNVYSIDSREYHEHHPNLISLKEDILRSSFPDDSFDLVVCVSTIEHIGLGAYGDPQYENGDKLAMKEFGRILKEGGTLLLTTPFSGKYKVLPLMGSYERIYDYGQLKSLFEGWETLLEEYYIPKKAKHWVEASRKQAEKRYEAYSRSNLSCLILKKKQKGLSSTRAMQQDKINKNLMMP
jgi:2-polyprenyl-3-methyl-5-hydroxy-6-metoxy-1,4-benzoquinol methylase